MPAAGLTPMEIAQVVTYVGNSFGNKLGVVTGDDVERWYWGSVIDRATK